VHFVASAEGEEVIFEAAFGEAGFEDAADLFRGMRDWFIEKFGLEAADKVLPSYRIDWLGDRELSTTPEPPAPLFTAPNPPPRQKDNPMAMTPEEIAAEEARLATERTALDARAAHIATQEAAARNTEHAAFAETLITDGKLLPANKDQFVAILDAMPADQAVSFSEGESTPVTVALMAMMTAQPKAVNFGQTDLGADPGDIAADATRLASFATAYQKEQSDAGNPISISEAVEHISKGGAK
jgi:hypothetical protein